jgi:hypothetical protein
MYPLFFSPKGDLVLRHVVGGSRVSRLIVCSALLFAFSSLQVAGATVVKPLEISELAAQSVHVIRGQVTARYTVPERGPRGEIYTRTDIRVLEYILGDGPREITVQQLGGELGELKMTLSGNAQLTPESEVLAFLDFDAERRLHFVVGLAQGVFEIDRTGPAATVHRYLDGLSFYVVGARPAPTLDQRRSLAEVLAILQSTLAPIEHGSFEGGLR